MANTKYAFGRHPKTKSEVQNVSISFVDELESGEYLTGTPVVVEVNTTNLTLTNKAVNTSALTINGIAVGTAQAVQCTVGTSSVAGPHVIRAKCGTTASAARTLVCNILLDVINDS